MKRLVPTLSLLALAGYAAAEVISDDAAKVTVGLYYQGRMDLSHGASTTGDTVAPSENAAGASDSADFYLRRARPSIKGTFGDGFIFQTTLAADNVGKNTTASSTAPGIVLFEAYAGRKWNDSLGTETLVGGKKVAWFYTGNANATTGMFATMRPTTPIGVPNNVGLAYKLETPMVRFGVDVLNNVGTGIGGITGGGDDTANGTNHSEGLFYSARVEITGLGDWTSAWQESFTGRPGHGFVLGLEAAAVNHDRLSDADAVTVGAQPGEAGAGVAAIEGMIHLDGLTAVADFRYQRTSLSTDAGADLAGIHSTTMTIQAGYAFETGIALVPVIEPAIRFAKIDNNVDNENEGASFGGATGNNDYGASGRQFEIGLNGYFNGHKNKLSLDYIRWTGEAGPAATNDDPNANILRVQHQLWF